METAPQIHNFLPVAGQPVARPPIHKPVRIFPSSRGAQRKLHIAVAIHKFVP